MKRVEHAAWDRENNPLGFFAFCEYIEMEPMQNRPADSIPTRQSLLARMKDWSDQASWQDFFHTYWRLIYGVALRAGLSAGEAEEVVQETVISVAKKIGEFKNDPALGSFKSWLMLITRRRIADQFRKRPPAAANSFPRPDETARTSTVERVPDPASLDLDKVWEEHWEKNLLDVAMDNVKRQVSARQFLLFYQQVVKEWPAAKVAEKYTVNLARVYMARYRVTRLVKKEVRKLQRRNL
jgi:RNA polymerase sigma-70 factor (ECF subfamily)